MQALYYFGKGYFDKIKNDDDMSNDNAGNNMDLLHKIKGQLSPADIRNLKDIMSMTPVWMQGVIRQIVM